MRQGSIFAQLFAHRCCLCDDPSTQALCTACSQDLPRQGDCCPQCALPLAHSEALCPDCLAHPKPFARTHCGFAYVFPLDSLIHQFKNRAYGPIASTLADELAGRIKCSALHYTALVPMPQHWRGLWARGRNPAAEVASLLSRRLGTPVAPLLRKTRHTPAQKHLTRQERWQNLAGSLAAAHSLSGGRYLLVDDVMTTGASSILASQVLLEAGAERVDVAVLARTPQK